MKGKLVAFLCSAVVLCGTVSSTTVSADTLENTETHYSNGLDYDITSEMEMSDWSNGDMFNCTWSPSNITFNNGVMDMVIDQSGDTYTGAEYRTTNYFSYGFYQVSMKPIKNDGVVSSFFTYTGPSDGTVWDEIDIEFLGKDTTHVQFNYYVNGRGNHEEWYDLGFDASESYHTYGFNWYEDGITWYVDGEPVYTTTSATDEIPSHAGKIMMNVWNGIGVDDWLNPFDGNTGIHAYYDWFAWDATADTKFGPSATPETDSTSTTTDTSATTTETITETASEATSETTTETSYAMFDSSKQYKIINYNSCEALDVNYGSMDNGANILQSPYNSTYGSQKWIIEQQSNGYYTIKNSYTGKVLSVQDSATWDGANVIQYEYQGLASQEWSFVAASDYTYKIINHGSGKALNVSWGSTSDYANIEQYDSVDSYAEQWWIDVD